MHFPTNTGLNPIKCSEVSQSFLLNQQLFYYIIILQLFD